MLNPIQRYFPKLHRLLAINPNTEVSFDTEIDTQFSPEPFDIDSIDSPIALKRLHDASNGLTDELKPLAVLKPVASRKAVSIAEVPIAELLKQAHELLGSGELPEAIDRYRHILQIDPTCGMVYPYLAEALSQQGELEAAAVCYRQAIELTMQAAASPKLSSNLVQTHPVQKPIEDEAIEAGLEDEAEDDAAEDDAAEDEMSWFEEASFYLQQGEALYNLGNWTEAVAACNQVIQRIEPELIESYLTAAKALQQQSDLNVAASLYLKAIAIQPNAEAHARLGSLYAEQNRLTDAAFHYQQAIALDPHFAGAYWKLAEVLWQLGDREEAALKRYTALRLEPTWASAKEYLQLGELMLKQSKLEEAIECYRRVLDRNSGCVEAYHGLGKALGKLGQGEEAVIYYCKAVELSPQNALLQEGLSQSLKALQLKTIQNYTELCNRLVKQEQWDEALPYYRKLTELQPKYASAWHELGDILNRLFRWSEASEAFRCAISLNPSFSWSHNNLGDALMHLEQWQEAADCYRQAIVLNPEFHSSYTELCNRLVKQEQWDEALPCYRKLTELQPKSASAWHELGDILNRLFRWSEASEAFRCAISLNPSFSWSHNNLGDALMHLEQWQEAADCYRQAIVLNPEFHWSYCNLGEALTKLEQWDEAINAYRQAMGLQADLPSIYLVYQKLGNALQQLMRSDPGLASSYHRVVLQKEHQSWEQAFQQQPDQAKHYLQLGKMQADQEQLDEAIIWYQLALELQPDYDEANFQLGNALLKQRDVNRAVNYYNKAIQLSPNNSWYYNGLADAMVAKYELEDALFLYRKALQINPHHEGLQQNLKCVNKLNMQWQRVVQYCKKMEEQKELSKAPNSGALKILMVMPYPPYPANTGGAIRMFEQIKYFGQRHHLTVVSFIFPEQDPAVEEKLQEYCDFAVMLNLGTPVAPRQACQQKQVHEWTTYNMYKVLNTLKTIQFDVVLFDFIFSSGYQSLFADSITILNEHNIESNLLQQCADSQPDNVKLREIARDTDAVKVFLDAEREAKLLKAYEDQTWQQFNLRTAVSENDCKEIQQRCSGQTILVRNGIDTQSILPVSGRNPKRILYMGSMTYYPNIDAVHFFVEQILPQIRAKDPEIIFCIAGCNPSPEIEQLAQQDTGIEVYANPSDMRDVAKDCGLTIAPLRLGSGTRIKVLHSMALGLPVVSTSLGCEGLEVMEGKHLLIRDRPEAFAEAVVRLCNDRLLREKLSRNGRQLVEQIYDWESIFTQYEKEIRRLVLKSE